MEQAPRNIRAGLFLLSIVSLLLTMAPLMAQILPDIAAAGNRFSLPADVSAYAPPGASPHIGGTETAMPLFLSVILNSHNSKLIAEFDLYPGQRMASPRSELEQIGIKLPASADKIIFLDQIPGLTYSYDAQHQQIALNVDEQRLVPKSVSGNARNYYKAPAPEFGGVLNYGLYASTPNDILKGNFNFSGASATLDSRIFSPVGVFANTGIVRTSGVTTIDLFRKDNTAITRYESAFSYSDQDNMITYKAGDVVTGGLPWTRPVRLGGAQVQRDFDLRGDVISRPLLSAAGTAAVPSTVDVYIGNVRSYSTQIDQGPYSLSDIPTITGQGDARIVLRDQSGRETETVVPFFASQNLLKPGIFDFSVEAGAPRQSYGLSNFAYEKDAALSASGRFGFSDALTVSGHFEGKSNVKMGGLGLSTVLFNKAEVSMAGGSSFYQGKTGVFAYANARTEFKGLTVSASTLHSFGSYADLAYVTGVEELGKAALVSTYAYLEPPKALDTVSFGVPLYFDKSSIGVSFIHSKRTTQEDYIVAASYSRNLNWHNASLSLNTFKDFTNKGGFGAFFSLSMPVGDYGYASTSVSRNSNGGYSPNVGIYKPVTENVGSYGYRADVSALGEQGNNDARFSYRTSAGLASVNAQTYNKSATANASFDGSIVAAGGGVFVGNTIYDSFAVVDAGLPDVPVKLQNRQVTTTGWNGKALVPGLQAYQNNKVSIDVNGLPVDANVSATDENVVPARRSGVNVNFHGGRKASALVVLRNASGAFVPAGASVKFADRDGEYFVGYDGQVWFEDGLQSQNTITATTDKGTCSALFAYQPDPGKQVIIDPVECK